MDAHVATYLLDVVARAAMLGILTLGLNLAFGYTGIINLAHVAFAGVGAYAYVIAVRQFQVPVLIAVLIALGITAALAATVSLLFRHISSDQLALVTLALALVIFVILLSWRDIFGAAPLQAIIPARWHNLTRGALGLSGIRRPAHISNIFWFSSFCLCSLAGCYLVGRFLTRSPFGRVMAAVRDDEIAARTLGKRSFRVKMIVLIISGMLAAVGGILMALYAQFIDPTSFHLNDLVLVLTALIIGGLGSLNGSIAGAAIVVAVTESLKFVPPAILPPLVFGPLRVVLYAGVLLAILLVRPKGLLGKISIN